MFLLILIFYLHVNTITHPLLISKQEGTVMKILTRVTCVIALIFAFFSPAAFATDDSLVVTETGEVGVGTDTPTTALDVNGVINGQPVVGVWAQTSTEIGVGNYIWDLEVLNTKPEYFGWVAGQDHIVIKKAGYYQISTGVLVSGLTVGGRADLEVTKNDNPIASSLCYQVTSAFCSQNHIVIDSFNVNDVVKVSISRGGDRFGHDVASWSKLTISKLN